MRMRSVNPRSTASIFVFPPILYNVDDSCLSPKFSEKSKNKLLKTIEKPYVDIVNRRSLHLFKDIPSLEIDGPKYWNSTYKIQCTISDSNNIFKSSFNEVTRNIELRPNDIQTTPISGSITITYELCSSDVDRTKYVYDTFIAIMPYKFVKPSLKFVSSEINGVINTPLNIYESTIKLTDTDGEQFGYLPGVILDIKIKGYENKIVDLYTQEFPNGNEPGVFNLYTEHTIIKIARCSKKNN
jgi:hypothetical protein